MGITGTDVSKEVSDMVLAGVNYNIALSLESDDNLILILDDLNARAIAAKFNFNNTGTVGVLLDTMYAKVLTKAKTIQMFDNLVTKTPFRISIKLYQSIILQINEFRV